ncbi:MAG: HAD family hydrolase [Oscillospiraceae bacterium]|jgi:phosphoglycolate phosphatase|nr:HAD family hydrolase [Oscillospiraceae bacterium]
MSAFAIFDLDGTLLDTIDDLADACNYALKKQGFPVHPVNPYKYFVGTGVMNLIRQALPAGARVDETVLRVKEDYDAYYAAHAQDKTKPYPGIVRALETLQERGVKIGVLSNKPHIYTCSLTNFYFPGLVDVMFGQREGVPHKPDPAAVFDMMRIMDVQNDEGFYIGDTSTDMQTGKNAGLYTIGVLWGFRTRDELEKHGADSIVDNSDDLIKIIVDK